MKKKFFRRLVEELLKSLESRTSPAQPTERVVAVSLVTEVLEAAGYSPDAILNHADENAAQVRDLGEKQAQKKNQLLAEAEELGKKSQANLQKAAKIETGVQILRKIS